MASRKLVSLIVSSLSLAIYISLAPIKPTMATLEDGYRLFNTVILLLEHQYSGKRVDPDVMLEDLKSYRAFDPKNTGDPEVDSQLDELISISNIDVKNCSPVYFRKLGRIEDKYSLLTRFILPYVEDFIERQKFECSNNPLKVFANTIDEISLDQRTIIDAIGKEIEPRNRLPMGELAFELSDLMSYETDEGKKIFGELYKDKDEASFGQLFKENLVDNLCQPIVKKLEIVGAIGIQSETSPILEQWLKNYQICSMMVERTDELIKMTFDNLHGRQGVAAGIAQ